MYVANKINYLDLSKYSGLLLNYSGWFMFIWELYSVHKCANAFEQQGSKFLGRL